MRQRAGRCPADAVFYYTGCYAQELGFQHFVKGRAKLFVRGIVYRLLSVPPSGDVELTRLGDAYV